jgi:hypothetical protein
VPRHRERHAQHEHDHRRRNQPEKPPRLLSTIPASPSSSLLIVGSVVIVIITTLVFDSSLVVAGAVDQEDEAHCSEGQYEAVEARPRAAAHGLGLVQVLLVPDVLDGGHGEVEPLSQLDAASRRGRRRTQK